MTRLPHRATVTAAAAWLAVCLFLSPAIAATASAADPSARDLWRSYPLHPRNAQGETSDAAPPSAATREPPGASTSTPASGATSETGSGDTAAWTIGAVVACIVAATAATLVLRRRSSGEQRPAVGISRDRQMGLAPEPALSAVSEPDPIALEPGAAGRRRLQPPDARGPWDARIEWSLRPEGSRFCLRTTSGDDVLELGESEEVEWPPGTDAGVEALVAAHADFEASIVAAGWKPVISEGPWYATSFVWEPKPATDAMSEPESDRWEVARNDGTGREQNARFRRERNGRHAERT